MFPSKMKVNPPLIPTEPLAEKNNPNPTMAGMFCFVGGFGSSAHCNAGQYVAREWKVPRNTSHIEKISKFVSAFSIFVVCQMLHNMWGMRDIPIEPKLGPECHFVMRL